MVVEVQRHEAADSIVMSGPLQRRHPPAATAAYRG
jgi:hypothetical protein